MALQQLDDELCVESCARVNSRTPLVGEELGDAVADADGEAVRLGRAEGVLVTFIATPLFHTRLAPLLMQVYRLPW